MPFGVRNAAQTFQRFIDSALCGLSFCYAYMEDVLIASTSPEEHCDHLQHVFERLQEQGLLINPQKCSFGVSELDFLGHHINADGITPLPTKVQAITDFPLPETQKQLRQ